MIRAENAKLIDTYFGALPELINKMEWQDNYIHGSYNQCVAATGRLSSTKPNMQNFSAAVDEVLVSRYD
jgi:DNA polymerase I-like protein with 3'-5' exonuclease and polymerase domains